MIEALDFLISLYNVLYSLTYDIIDFFIILLIFVNVNKFGLVGGFSEYPVTSAPKSFKKIQSQLPLNPVWPVTKTLFVFQNFLFK